MPKSRHISERPLRALQMSSPLLDKVELRCIAASLGMASFGMQRRRLK